MNLSVDSTKLCSNSKTPTIAENSTCRHKLHSCQTQWVHYRLREKVEDLYDQARLWESTMSSCIEIQTTRYAQTLKQKGVKAWLRLLKSFQKSFQGRSTYLGVEICERIGRLQVVSSTGFWHSSALAGCSYKT